MNIGGTAKKYLIGVAFTCGMLMSSGQAQAATLSILFDHADNINDCKGVFGDNFNDCNVAFGGQELSPVIAKYENDLNGISDINDASFPTVDGSEFSVNEATESWTYNPDTGDPAIKYWVLKQSGDFRLYWDVVGSPAACATVASLACLLLATPITTGSWAADWSNFSHVTWYDTSRSGGVNPVVPLPGGILLLISALGGLGFLARVRKAGTAA